MPHFFQMGHFLLDSIEILCPSPCDFDKMVHLNLFFTSFLL